VPGLDLVEDVVVSFDRFDAWHGDHSTIDGVYN
jgi:hypothetical protein